MCCDGSKLYCRSLVPNSCRSLSLQVAGKPTRSLSETEIPESRLNFEPATSDAGEQPLKNLRRIQVDKKSHDVRGFARAGPQSLSLESESSPVKLRRLVGIELSVTDPGGPGPVMIAGPVGLVREPAWTRHMCCEVGAPKLSHGQ